ncbi:DNA cytosine methyltransferase [Fusobacterium varium]|jgi:DNA (cytosine-5)-methyltransferase 1
MYNTIDLFAGAGGLSLGFMQTKKFDIKVAFEFNPAMQETYKKNHPGVAVFGDVRDADYTLIREKYGDIDVVIGGPPCQGFSNANRQKNHAISQNNSLVKQFIRAILELRPKAFVMENVSMLRSDVHRFYLCGDDQELVNSNVIETANTEMDLLGADFMFEGVLNIVQSQAEVAKYKWDDFDYLELNVIYKASQNVSKFKGVLEKHKARLIKIAEKHRNYKEDDVIINADYVAFNAMLDFYAGKIEKTRIKKLIEPAIMYQRMISKVQEIFDNDIVVDSYIDNKGLIANIRSYAVFDYLKAKLSGSDDNDGYVISADVLSATQFGAPQKRMRFVVMGIRKDITDEVKLPEGKFKEGPCRTVEDAIKDLEDVVPVFNVFDDVEGIKLQKKSDLSELAQSLRDSKVLHNHIITKTTETAMERFRALDQGQNFHSLSDELKTNTYTDVTRTQNTIYLRLKYDEPSGTVVNVRKSMWVHPTQDRAVSIREAARLQTFPDSFVFCGTKDKQYQQVGNAVPPIMAKAIAKKLANQLNKALVKK